MKKVTKDRPITFGELILAKKLAEQAGGVEKAKLLLKRLEKRAA